MPLIEVRYGGEDGNRLQGLQIDRLSGASDTAKLKLVAMTAKALGVEYIAPPKRFVKARAVLYKWEWLECYHAEITATLGQWGKLRLVSRDHPVDEPNARKNAIAWLGRQRRKLRLIGIKVGRMET